MRERKLIVHIIPFENRRQILVTHDATESERIEAMRRDFIANASHELRTPLTVINGFLEIAYAPAEPGCRRRGRRHLKLMAEQGQRMQHLVEDMLTLTRLESIDYPMRPERVNIACAAGPGRCAKRSALSAGKHTLIAGGRGPDIRAVPTNCAAPSATWCRTRCATRRPAAASACAGSRAKTGRNSWCGTPASAFAPNTSSRLTERFYRVDKSRSRETQGTGLGLAIVKHVLLRHHATLAIESEPGKGSTFTMQFPRASIVDATAG